MLTCQVFFPFPLSCKFIRKRERIRRKQHRLNDLIPLVKHQDLNQGSGVLLTCKTTQVLICFLTVYVVLISFLHQRACKLIWGRDIMPVRVLTGWHTQTRIVQGGFNRGRKVGRVSGDHRGKYSTLGVTDRQIPP